MESYSRHLAQAIAARRLLESAPAPDVNEFAVGMMLQLVEEGEASAQRKMEAVLEEISRLQVEEVDLSRSAADALSEY